MNIKLLDLAKLHDKYFDELQIIFMQVLKDSAFIGFDNNPYLRDFENEFANYLGTNYCLGVANGTDALELALITLGIKDGDEVIVPTHTWISTAEAVSYIGAKPVFVDTDPDYYTINPIEIKKVIGPKTKAIMAVHLFGHPCDMISIGRIAKEYSIKIIEDCAQAHGASINGKKVGTFGDISCFSFFPGKNLGAFGDAGCIVCNKEEYYETIRMLRNHGQFKKNDHRKIGRNSRLDGLNAAILKFKLKYLEELNQVRINHSNLYKSILSDEMGIILPKVRYDSNHVFHQFVIRVSNREAIMKGLLVNGIESAVHYPNILPNTFVYSKSNNNSKYPVSSNYIKEILSLPIDPLLSRNEILFVAETLKTLISSNGKN